MFIGARGEPKTELISLSNVLLEPPLPSLVILLVRVCRKLNILPFSTSQSMQLVRLEMEFPECIRLSLSCASQHDGGILTDRIGAKNYVLSNYAGDYDHCGFPLLRSSIWTIDSVRFRFRSLTSTTVDAFQTVASRRPGSCSLYL